MGVDEHGSHTFSNASDVYLTENHMFVFRYEHSDVSPRHRWGKLIDIDLGCFEVCDVLNPEKTDRDWHDKIYISATEMSHLFLCMQFIVKIKISPVEQKYLKDRHKFAFVHLRLQLVFCAVVLTRVSDVDLSSWCISCIIVLLFITDRDTGNVINTL